MRRVGGKALLQGGNVDRAAGAFGQLLDLYAELGGVLAPHPLNQTP